MKLLKKLFYVLVLLIVVIGIAITCLTIFVDPNRLKPILAKEVTKQTGYQVKIEGNLTWSIYPRLGVKAQRMTFTQPGQAEAFADLNSVLFVTDLKQLMDGKQPYQGSIFIASARLMNLELKKVYVGWRWESKMLTLKPITASLYEGSLQAEAYGENLSNVPRWKWVADFNKVQFKPLLQDVNHGNNKLNISGVGHINMQAASRGNSKDQLLNSLDGTLEFSLNNGVVEGIDMNYLVKMADALINKQPLPMPESDQTSFDSLTGSAIIKNGVATTDNLLLVAPSFSTRGQGYIDFMAQILDYHLQISPSQAGKSNWTVPVAVTGSLQSPSVKLDAGKLNVLVTKEQLDKAKKKVEKEIKRLPENADKFLKKLMGE